jgi:hypothetical protein
MIGQSQIIVRAQIEDLFAIRGPNMSPLWRADRSFGFIEALPPNLNELFRQMLLESHN